MSDEITRQPPALTVLSFAEFWDRFSYYGIQAVLVLYLTHALSMSDERAYAMYGVYTTLSFSLPLIGGYLADHYLGHAHAALLGLVLMVGGNVLLGWDTATLSHWGIACFLCGIGLFKANSASLLGTFYEKEDTRREHGFALFYMGMNIGAVLGPICLGILSVQADWSAGFFINALGIALGGGFFLYRYRYLHSTSRHKHWLDKPWYYLGTLMGIALAITGVAYLFQYPLRFSWFIWPVVVLVIVGMFVHMWRSTREQRQHVLLLMILMVFALFFFACSLQVGSSVTLFIDRFVDRTVFDITIPTAAFSSLQPLFVIISAACFVPIWRRFTHHAPSNQAVMGRVSSGLLLAGIGFFLFALIAWLAAKHVANDYLLWGIVLANISLAIGEVCIGPGLIAAVTYLAPASLQGTLMGFWFFTIAVGSYIGSLFAKLNAPTDHNVTPWLFAHNFMWVGIFVVVVGILLMLIKPALRRWL